MRFISRRGRVSHIYSDYGTNYVGTQSQLADLYKLMRDNDYNKEIFDYLMQRGIQWHFNPPASPHFGGIFEAGIKSAKKLYLKVVDTQILIFEKLYTVFTEVEALLNSCPLSTMSLDPNALRTLTPE